jgi:hypothetical protein
MLLLLHGAAGGFDELAIAAVALAVLWIAVKLAGRKPATDDQAEEVATAEEEHQDPAHPSATKLG